MNFLTRPCVFCVCDADGCAEEMMKEITFVDSDTCTGITGTMVERLDGMVSPLQLKYMYKDFDALPNSPSIDGILVLVENDGTGRPTLVFSLSGCWYNVCYK